MGKYIIVLNNCSNVHLLNFENYVFIRWNKYRSVALIMLSLNKLSTTVIVLYMDQMYNQNLVLSSMPLAYTFIDQSLNVY
jgi:hypothetical protein